MTAPLSKPDKTLLFSMLSFTLGCAMWLGSLVFFGIGVAPILFKILPSKDLAGAVNAVILHRLNMLELAGATLIGVGIVLVWQRLAKRDRIVLVGILVGMLLIWCAYALVITAEMNTLRAAINSFDAPSTASLESVKAFRGLHSWYSRLVGANMLAAIVLIVVQTRLYLRLAVFSANRV